MTQAIETCINDIEAVMKRYANNVELCSWNIIKEYIIQAEQKIDDSQDYLTYE